MEAFLISKEEFNALLQQLEEIKKQLRSMDRQAPLSEKWLDNDELAGVLKVSKRTLQSYRDEGRISFSQVGSKIYYRASDVEAFLAKHHHRAFNKSY
jgi:excisionase family DNA binding protein